MIRAGQISRGLALTILASCIAPALRSAAAQGVPAPALATFDFSKQAAAGEWNPSRDISRVTVTPQGLRVDIARGDPYLVGPARDYPEGEPLWVSVRLLCAQGGTGKVYYFKDAATEARSALFHVGGGTWVTARVPLPALGPGYHLRLNVPGDHGVDVVAGITVSQRVVLQLPAWAPPAAAQVPSDSPVVRSGPLVLAHSTSGAGEFTVSMAGRLMASGYTSPHIGYLQGEMQRWVDIAAAGSVKVVSAPNAITVTTVVTDSDGARWTIERRYERAELPDAINVSVRVTVTQDRDVVFLPMLVLLPGSGSFGTSKGQALFAGLEYLDKDEPSSSEADVIGPASHREVPDLAKVTAPLMAVQAEHQCIGLTWLKTPEYSAVFDSPDRTLKSGGHLIGLIFPGSDGDDRSESSLLPYAGTVLKSNRTLVLQATILGASGESVAPVIREYVAVRGIPIPPATPSWGDYVALATAGWLDSGIRDGGQYRHAIPGSFPPQPAGDAALLMDWLAAEAGDPALSKRLAEAAQGAVAAVPAAELDVAGVGHVRYPAASLIFGHVGDNGAQALQAGRSLLSRFQPDGSVLYEPRPGGTDFGKTNTTREADGLTAQVVLSLLEDAVRCGDPGLLSAAHRDLDAMDRFLNTVPRGAQTWEVPLHTPDILASALLVRAYTLGYTVFGEARYLETAKYWAWTGVPFIYLVPPTPAPIGMFATIPVYGASNWSAPVWIGRPVQWCGLVYADALYWLAKYDPTGPWTSLANGITASGIQQTWPKGADAQRQGLLPDSLGLKDQQRANPAINPATLMVNAIRLYARPALYDMRAFPAAGVIVHAPGSIDILDAQPNRITMTVAGWSTQPYSVLVVGLKSAPHVRINDQDAPNAFGAAAYDRATGRLVVTAQGSPKIEIWW